jgi:hypothetical protein
MKANNLPQIIVFGTLIATQFACMNYYKISKSPQNNSTPDTTIQANLNRYFILRNGDSAYHMNNISNYKDLLTCKLEALPTEHSLHLRHGINGNMRFKKYKTDSVVLKEVHIYQKKDPDANTGNDYTLMYNKIERIEVLEKNKTRTTISYVLGGIAIIAPIVGLVGLAASAVVFTGF